MISRKAWRFEGEMNEIAVAMRNAGLPPDFHVGAGELYRRLSAFKDGPDPTLEDLLAAILGRV